MQTVKIRRVGNSNVVTLSRQFEEAGYREGSEVVIDQLPNGALTLMPVSAVRRMIQEVGREQFAANREAFDFLTAYDRGEVTRDGEPIGRNDLPHS